ncbi:MAG: hypothetical protein LBS09_07760 [Bacteroidales bacterium]|jgi:hypothetical protein|nr:hypothetical protein [Bacteroidales bacterium]
MMKNRPFLFLLIYVLCTRAAAQSAYFVSVSGTQKPVTIGHLNLGGINPAGDREMLRYSVRSDGKTGFVFLHNFQGHDKRADQPVGGQTVCLNGETLNFHTCAKSSISV